MAAPKIGLALGGGGARGFAHIHALQAFDDACLKPSLIAGTSIGALIGACYASGMSGDAVEVFTRERFRSRLKIINDLLLFNRNAKQKISIDNGIKLTELNMEKTLSLLMPDELKQTFHALDIPLKVIATDFDGQCARVLDSGDLLPALSASAAMPGLFTPVVFGDSVFIDGTFTNPVPFDILHGEVDIIVAIDVCGFPRRRHKQLPKKIDVITATSHMMQQAIVQAKAQLYQPDILRRPKVQGIRVHDFMKITRVLDITQSLRKELTVQLLSTVANWSPADTQEKRDLEE